MNARELTLNIAVNLGRVSRWSSEGKAARVNQFLKETETYIADLAKAKKSSKFEQTLSAFLKEFNKLKSTPPSEKYWAEDALTWANILTHRAKLA